MAVDTHGRWPWVAVACVVPAWAAIATRRGNVADNDRWVAGLAFPILVSHQIEEWVRPGGFLRFCNRELLGSDDSDWPLTERIGFHVNVTAGWTSALLAAVAWSRTPAPAAGVLWMEAGNAAMHLGMAARHRSYNPGAGTAALLLAPHAVAGALAVHRSDRLSRRGGLLAAAMGVAFLALPVAMKLRMRASERPDRVSPPSPGYCLGMEDRDQEIIASLRRTYDALSRGDFDSAIEIAAPDIEFVTTGGFTSLRGAEQVRAWMEPETIENVTMEPEHFEVVGNKVLVRQLSRGRGVESRISVEMRFWTVWTINESGLATRIVAFRNDEEAKARDAVGLSE